jgi:hypothetical protein
VPTETNQRILAVVNDDSRISESIKASLANGIGRGFSISIQEIRDAASRYRSLPTIFVTAHQEPGACKRVADLGPNALLCKVFDGEQPYQTSSLLE